MVANVQFPLGTSARSATGSDEDRRRHLHSKDASFLGFSKAALRFFKLSKFTCKAERRPQAAGDEEADAGKKPNPAKRKWRFLKPRAAADEGSASSQTGDELSRRKSHINSGEKEPRDGEEANAADKKSKDAPLDILLREEEGCAGGSTIGKSTVVGSDEIASFSRFLTNNDGAVELQKEAPYWVNGNANKHGAGEASFNGHGAGDRVLMEQQGQKEEFGEEEEEVVLFDDGKKPDDARRKWCFLEPRAAVDGGSAASQAGGSGELARPKNHVKPELGEKKPSEEANAVDKKSKETLFDRLLTKEEDCTGDSTIGQNNGVDSYKIANCTLSQFLTSDDGPVELQKEASNYVTGSASKNGVGGASFQVHDAGGRVITDQQGQKEEYGEEEEEEVIDDRSTNIVTVNAESKSIKTQWRNSRTKYSTFRLFRELVRRVPADNPVSMYVSKMLSAVGSARDLLQPVLSSVNLKKEFLVLAASHASLVTAKMRKALKHDVGAPAPVELWKKEIIMGRRCKKRDLEGFSARWNDDKEVSVICPAEELASYSLEELLEMASKF